MLQDGQLRHLLQQEWHENGPAGTETMQQKAVYPV
jgi:hypothetical protein